MSKTLDDIKIYRHDMLRNLLSQCTESQINLFNRMYGSIDTIPDEKINWAIQQCERTIEKNNKII